MMHALVGPSPPRGLEAPLRIAPCRWAAALFPRLVQIHATRRQHEHLGNAGSLAPPHRRPALQAACEGFCAEHEALPAEASWHATHLMRRTEANLLPRLLRACL